MFPYIGKGLKHAYTIDKWDYQATVICIGFDEKGAVTGKPKKTKTWSKCSIHLLVPTEYIKAENLSQLSQLFQLDISSNIAALLLSNMYTKGHSSSEVFNLIFVSVFWRERLSHQSETIVLKSSQWLFIFI